MSSLISLQPRIKFQGHFAPQAVNLCPSVGGPLMFPSPSVMFVMMTSGTRLADTDE